MFPSALFVSKLLSEANKYLTEALQSVNELELEDVIENIIDAVEKQPLSSNMIERATVEAAVQECSQSLDETIEHIFNIIGAFDVPRYVYSSERKKFLPLSMTNHPAPNLFGTARDKAELFRERYTILQQRLVLILMTAGVNSRAYYGNINFFGGPSSTSVKASPKLKQLEDENEDAMFVFVSDVWLDQVEVLEKLRTMFSDSLKALADIICEYPSIHKRVQYCTQEIIIFREDLVNKMCRNCVRFPSTNLDIPNHFVKTILSQGHLTPLPLYVSPVFWAYDYSLRVYPVPDLIVTADKYDPFTVTNTDCVCINPGSFPRSGFSFKVFYPSNKTVEDSMDLTSCTTTSSQADPSLAPSNGTDLPTCPGNSLYPAVPTECLSRSAEPPLSCSGDPDRPAAPCTLTAPVCPPFQCTQDEESLTLLLQVPNIQPESLKGEVGTNHYRLSFSSKDAASYSFLLQFPLENKLTPPEAGINVSPNNAVIGLAKSPESGGLWGKMYFGLDSNTLQERLFVSEENVDEFLDSVLCPSFLKQTTLESQPLIEVLDVTEVKSQIRLKSQEVKHCELGEKEQRINNSGRDQVEKENRNYLKTNIEANHIAADTAGDHGTETDITTGSFTTAKTIGVVDCSSGHCLQVEPIDTSLAISGKSQINEPQLELALTTGKSATSSDCEKQELLHVEEQAKIRRDEEVLSSEPAEENQHHLNCRPVSPIIKEMNMQDGSVQIIRDHTTHSALIFQNSLLYELD
ncbi:DNA polymerase epsilon subunit 2 [Chelonia mydas]|uniref:DNA polymerase epsilon subunit 2 n=1 Tax=Chelonia mydas TaxID=8469 RepID=M7AZX1_CHEMY|nr:DNA polymerase epsilon subunit 2 [Chelonia mydas]